MNSIDDRIRAILNEETRDIDLLDQQSVAADLAQVWQGKYRLLWRLAAVKWLFAVVLGIVSIYQFFQQESVMAMIAWSCLLVLCGITLATIYVLFWISVSRDATQQALKQLELQVALLLASQANGDSDNLTALQGTRTEKQP
ncbi:MAG: hypothetical protein KDI36_10005 [Pseudomonadales bacterium]|nr:hypothetical protein [Pseudomonadales bacterium]